MEADKTIFKVENEKILIMERTFDFVPSIIFEAYKNINFFKKWFAPDCSEILVESRNFSAGGIFLYRVNYLDENTNSPEGQPTWGKEIYSSIIENKEISYVYYSVDSLGDQISNRHPVKINLSFQEVGNGTKLVSREEYFSKEVFDESLFSEMGILDSFSDQWVRLENFLKNN